MIFKHFFTSEACANEFIRGHKIYNRVKRGWRINKATGRREYGYWAGYESRPKLVDIKSRFNQ